MCQVYRGILQHIIVFSSVIFIVLCTLLPQAIAQSASSDQSPPAERCADGYAFDAASSACVQCNVPCQTGRPGICGRGIMQCEAGKPRCLSTITPGERLEICNGDDDDCDGTIDEGYDKDGDGYTTCGGDCNDRNAKIHPDAIERCDGEDNNCNGLTDDGFNIGGLCTEGMGECKREGRLRCQESGFGAECDVKAASASEELCDGRDNNCDGQVDEGLGEITCGVGACERRVPACEQGKSGVCRPGKPELEYCGNAIDDDCDGLIDEGFEALGRTCYEGVGACKQVGKMICDEKRLSLICSARASEPMAEICGNARDDDCDGVVDTDVPGLGEICENGQNGECARQGTMICDPSSGTVICSAPQVEPQQEVCDGLDNNCNGEIDEGIKNACGGCGELPGKIGEGCLVREGDVCADGVWVCSTDRPGEAHCSLDPSLSNGRDCETDANPCTRDVCQDGVCAHPPAVDGLGCDDQNPCTVSDACVAGQCVGGLMLACNDQNPCTEDSCDPERGCYHIPLGGGMINVCGGCEVLEHAPGEACVLHAQLGPCREGGYICQPEGTLSCVQKTFPVEELCNGIDDDCDGVTDEELGSTECGIGACRNVADNCLHGIVQECEPKDPLPETCGNMEVDDDCNGIKDDIAGLHAKCSVTIGTCVVSGTQTCVGDAESPVCVPSHPLDVEDEDGDGIINYCDRDRVDAQSVVSDATAISEGPISGRSQLFDLSKTRAIMIPWSTIFDVAVINAQSPDEAMLLISGDSRQGAGIGVLRAKDVSLSGGLSFSLCEASEEMKPRHLLAVDERSALIASTQSAYVEYPKIASHIPSPEAGLLRCDLQPEILDQEKERHVTSRSGSMTCEVEEIADLALVSARPLILTGAFTCSPKGGSLLSRRRHALGLDLFTEKADGSFARRSSLVFEGKDEIERLHLLPFGSGVSALFVLARSGDHNMANICLQRADGWSCRQHDVKEVSFPIAFAQRVGNVGDIGQFLLIGEEGEAFLADVAQDGTSIKFSSIGTVKGDLGEGEVQEGVIFRTAQGGGSKIVYIGRERGITAALLKQQKKDSATITPQAHEILRPASEADDIFPGGRFSFGRPRFFVPLPLKGYGGRDLFAAYDIRKGSKSVGQMGFLYWNANDPPEGTITDVRFDGLRGRAKLSFRDSTGDALRYRAWIRAAHGGSLDHWLDGLERGLLRFSVKGETSAVGMWPIEVIVEAQDSGGQAVRSKAVIERDGKIVSISDLGQP